MIVRESEEPLYTRGMGNEPVAISCLRLRDSVEFSALKTILSATLQREVCIRPVNTIFTAE